ncbi:DNA primase [Pseudochrobactrum sp. MP213Fo]|uniref:DNA primase n=1 Tax=Pseudochrobactrum sp. MP213Fo TaxID=3022250 RepID=UPI003B9F9D50
MRFPPSFLDEIRERVPISTVIGTRVSFDRKKTNASKGDFWACCPFHGEKSPSFHCEDRKGRYHCFGCGVTGDHFRFLTDLEGLSFPEAVTRIADMAGVPMPVMDAEQQRREEKRGTLYDVLEMAAQFFEDQLQASNGAKARSYLRDRGLSAQTQAEFRIGYAPEGRNILKEYLAAKGASREQIEASGMVVYGEGIAVSYDRFRDRVMFPITDSRNRVIAFGGRALSPDAPAKYLNSPETELFHKGQVLYNLVRARRACQAQHGEEAKPVIAVEGYMDVIALAQAGFNEVVAPLGTALTEEQMALLWRVSSEPVLCFDGDQAGLRAAYRAVDTGLPNLQPGKSLAFALLPEGKDPDDLVKEQGASAFGNILREAKPLAEMLWMRETSGGNFETPERRAELDARLRTHVARIKDESVKHYYGQHMREKSQALFGPKWGRKNNDKSQNGFGNNNFGNKSNFQQRGKGNNFGGSGGGYNSGKVSVSDSLARSSLVKTGSLAPSLREATIVLTLINHPALIDENFETVATLELNHAGLTALHAALLDVMASHLAEDGKTMRKILNENGFSDLLDELELVVRRARLWPATILAAEDDSREALKQAMHLQLRARTLHKELRAVEAALSEDASAEVFARFIDIQNEIRKADATEALIEGFGQSSGRPPGGF